MNIAVRFRLLPISLICVVAAAAQTTQDVPAVAGSNNELALRLYRELSQAPGNVLFSPISISHALAMAFAGARGETAKEMATAMSIHLPADRFHKAFSFVVRQLSLPNEPYELLLPARVWGDQKYAFSPVFLELLDRYYLGGLGRLDFMGAPEAARGVVNEWVRNQTRDHIRDLLRPGMVKPYTKLLLTSAFYFKAPWKIPFQTKLTAPGEFHLSATQKVQVPMMRRSNVPLRYFSDPDMLGVELPYKNEEIAMILLMPAKQDGLRELEKRLSNAELETRLNALKSRMVDLTLPRFKMTKEYSLKDPLQALGMVKTFDPGQADFSGMAASGGRELFLTDGIHKAFVDVNEQGTEAAAATGFGMEIAMRSPAVFHADRPFLYLIRESRTGIILFLGRVSDPR